MKSAPAMIAEALSLSRERDDFPKNYFRSTIFRISLKPLPFKR
jgi:hypothetical protein